MSETSCELRVENLAPSDSEQILGRFDALKPNHFVVLVGVRDLAPVLRRFQSDRPWQFDWDVLEAGPDRFRVRVTRRSTVVARRVTEYLEGDHCRLDGLLAEAGRLAHAGAFPEAEACFVEFSCGLNRHINAEETVLFPAFEEMTGMANGPTGVMRAEHVEIRRRMGVASQALTARDGAACRSAIDGLADSLSTHNLKEEHILYPTTDRMAGTDEARDALVARLQTV